MLFTPTSSIFFKLNGDIYPMRESGAILGLTVPNRFPLLGRVRRYAFPSKTALREAKRSWGGFSLSLMACPINFKRPPCNVSAFFPRSSWLYKKKKNYPTSPLQTLRHSIANIRTSPNLCPPKNFQKIAWGRSVHFSSASRLGEGQSYHMDTFC